MFTEDGPWANDTVTNVYTARLRTGLGLQQPTSFWTNQFGYDSAKHLTSVVSPAGEFDYTLGGTAPASALIKQLLLPNTSVITNAYDGDARLTKTHLRTSGGSLLDSAEYIYNVANQRTSAGLTDAASGLASYAYDPIGQLKVANSTTVAEKRGYRYDAARNLACRTNNGSSQQFFVDNKNELTSTTFGAALAHLPPYKDKPPGKPLPPIHPWEPKDPGPVVPPL